MLRKLTNSELSDIKEFRHKRLAQKIFAHYGINAKLNKIMFEASPSWGFCEKYVLISVRVDNRRYALTIVHGQIGSGEGMVARISDPNNKIIVRITDEDSNDKADKLLWMFLRLNEGFHK